MRPVTIFTGQWADMPFDTLCSKMSSWGYDGLEIACWGEHLNVDKAVENDAYVRSLKDTMEKYHLQCHAIANHLAGQLVCSRNDERFDVFAPGEMRGQPEKMRAWAVDQMKKTAVVAHLLGASVVTGFTGSSIWEGWYSFPPVSDEWIEAGYRQFADLWNPILDVYEQNGITFALEVHPTEIAFDSWTTMRTLDAIKHRASFGINFDPSHLYWQGIAPDQFIYDFKDRIYHVHVKDAMLNPGSRSGILGSHITFGDMRRGWNFVSPGRGGVNFERIIRALNDIGYDGPLSVEWEDSGMERESGAQEALAFVRGIDFKKSGVAFDKAMSNS